MDTTATISELETALMRVNEKYDGNIRFKRLEQKNGRRVLFTLTVNSSREAGHRLGNFTFSGKPQRRMAAACWHAHGDFFESLFEVNPQAVVRAGIRKITRDAGNWQDWNIGSMMQPMYYSEACECNS